jgi:hypothetical protein
LVNSSSIVEREEVGIAGVIHQERVSGSNMAQRGREKRALGRIGKGRWELPRETWLDLLRIFDKASPGQAVKQQ